MLQFFVWYIIVTISLQDYLELFFIHTIVFFEEFILGNIIGIDSVGHERTISVIMLCESKFQCIFQKSHLCIIATSSSSSNCSIRSSNYIRSIFTFSRYSVLVNVEVIIGNNTILFSVILISVLLSFCLLNNGLTFRMFVHTHYPLAS